MLVPDMLSDKTVKLHQKSRALLELLPMASKYAVGKLVPIMATLSR